VSERIQRRIERLLDRAEEAADAEDWDRVAESAQMVLALDAQNADAMSMLAMVREAGATAAGVIGSSTSSSSSPLPAGEGVGEVSSDVPGPSISAGYAVEGDPSPTSFATGRYNVQKFLGEGGKKRV
jgi:hypothetical protein